ncbi:hypothetical protein SESBI_01805 [Sesbania bispinosa]|nr:hypothetical protein SESBI_01805 [Sesbania bispinosa]
MGATKNSEGEMMKLLRIALTCCEGDVDKRWDLIDALDKIQEVKERDSDEYYYYSFASEADMKSKASSGEAKEDGIHLRWKNRTPTTQRGARTISINNHSISKCFMFL